MWATRSLLIHSTVSPVATARPGGLETQAVDRDRVRLGRGLPAGERDHDATAISHQGRGERPQYARSAPCHRRLQVLGVLEVRDERRAHLDEQRLQLGVRGAGDQRLVDRVEHLLVVRDLVVDVRLVERRALERLQVRDVLLAAGLQALAGGVVLRA